MLKVAKLMRSVANRDLPAAEVNITEGDVVLSPPLALPTQSILEVNLGFWVVTFIWSSQGLLQRFGLFLHSLLPLQPGRRT
jgi:hypothetical protein